MGNNAPFVQPGNSQKIFAVLRDVLAELYEGENEVRVVVADAGLDAKQIAFSARAQTNWQHILTEALRQKRLDELLAVVLTVYGSNPQLEAVYHTSR